MSQELVHQKAAAVRAHREAIEARVETGELSLDALFAGAGEDPVLAETKLLGLVESIPDIGKVQSRRAFESVGLAETVRVGAVDESTQTALAGVLGLT